MDDVFGQVLLAARDPDFLAGNLVGPVSLRDRLGAQQAQVRTAVGLGQVHGPGPLERGQLGQVERLLRVRPAHMDRRIAAVSQAGVHGERHVGRRRHLGERQVHDMRQTLAAIGRVRPQRRPATLDQLGVGILEAGRRCDRIVRAPGAAFLVAHAVKRRQHLGGELAGFLQDRLDGVHRGVGKCGQVGVSLQLQHVAQQEDVIPHGGLIGHG